MISLTLKEIAEAVDGKIIGNVDASVNDITTDSRKIKEGDLFVAIKGDTFDGHNFIEKSLNAGAVCTFSSVETINVPENKSIILVEDTKKALGQLSSYYLQNHRIPVVAITGSVGKTTTKDLIASVLSQRFSVLKTKGNYNNDIGLPLTIFSMENENNIAVLEMGMNSFGEISYLSKIAKPDVAVITNVGVSHIENLGSREGILKAKLEIFDYFCENGLAVLNADDDMLITVKNKLLTDTTWFGVDNKSDVFADNIKELGLKGISCTIHTMRGNFNVDIPTPGSHMVLNAMAATIVGLRFNLSLDEIKKGIECFEPTKMRMAVSKTNSGIYLINDAYNANPVSMKAALDVLSSAEGEKLAILGDMFELGDFSMEMHSQVGEYAAEKNIDILVAIGSYSKAMYKSALDNGIKKAYYFESVENFIDEINNIVQKKDTILVKASRGMHFEKIVDKIQEVE